MESVKFNESQNIVMEEGEVAITSVQKIKFTKGSTFHSTWSPSGYGIATIGTKKIYWINDKRTEGISFPIEQSTHKFNKKSFTRKASIEFTLQDGSTFLFEFGSSGSSDFNEKLETVIKRRNDELEAERKKQKRAEEKRAAEKQNAAAHVGIAGVVKREKEKVAEANESLQAAFADTDSLMTSAKELVAIAERLRKVNKSNDENSEFNDYLIQMGISSPVTKSASGARFHSELARQLSDFVVAHLRHTHLAMVPLTDLYCVFNRARGTEMVSPDDLLRAASLLEDLKLPVVLQRLDSGVEVVRLASFTQETINKKIAEYFKKSNSINELDYAQNERIALAIAREQLSNAEKSGLLCRDETEDGVSFYQNIFDKEFNILMQNRPEWNQN